MRPAGRLAMRLHEARARRRLALLPYLVAGFPDRARSEALLCAVGAHADVVELGLPFSDPIADGPVLAAAARFALAGGASFAWTCELAARVRGRMPAGLVLMSYLNPLLAVGLARAVAELAAAGFEGLIVPDLPLEEGTELRALADAHGIALVQLVTPLTPHARRAELAAASRGFLYAVTRAGTTGERAEPDDVAAYLGDLRARTALPVCAGFGVREAAQVRALASACDGVVVGTALAEIIGRGEDPVPFLVSLRTAANAAACTP